MAKSFKYKGILFTPLRRFEPIEKKEGCEYVLRRASSDTGIHNDQCRSAAKTIVADWNHDDFCKAAIASDPQNKEIDVFLMGKGSKSVQVVPMTNYLAFYDDTP